MINKLLSINEPWLQYAMKQSKTESNVETFIGLMKKHINITELDLATAVALIDHITISASAVKPREIAIYYNFIGNAVQ